MFRYNSRGRSLFTSALTSGKTSWDPTASLSLGHPTLVLLEKCRTRDHFKQILAKMVRIHLTSETFPMSRLLFFSAISHPENLDMAILLFNHLTPSPNLYIYNTMISALSFSPTQSFSLYNSMLRSCAYPDKHTLLYLLKASKVLPEAKQIHNHAIVTGFLSYGYLQNSLIKMYSEYGAMDLAHQVFQQMPQQDVVSFNIMIVGFAKNECSLESLVMFHEMISSGLNPDEFTMVGLLMSCGRLQDTLKGNSVHAWIARRMLVSGCNSILGNALLDMYVKCGELRLARRVFDTLGERDIVSWNTIIAGYTKAGELEVANALFSEMPNRDLVSWNSLIAGYAQRGDWPAQMKLFRDMVAVDVKPDQFTILSLICAAAEAGALHQGRWVHGWVVRRQMKMDAFLGSALVDMYCKCGSIERALMVFDMVSSRDVTMWTVMIAGFAIHGYGSRALEMFWRMQEDVLPNQVTFVAVLTACSHSGMVDQGLGIFNSMKEGYGIEPGVSHYGCLVDLLARAGKLSEAKSVIENMPMEPTASIWGTLLNASKAHGNMELAETSLNELLKHEPEKEGGYILLSNLYAAHGKWSKSKEIRAIMENRGVKKMAGCSSLLVDRLVHEFIAADKRHPKKVEIYSILNLLIRDMNSSMDVSLDI